MRQSVVSAIPRRKSFAVYDCLAIVISRPFEPQDKLRRETLFLYVAANARFLAPLGMTKLGLFW